MTHVKDSCVAVRCNVCCSVSYLYVAWRPQCCCRMRRTWMIGVLQCLGMCVVVYLVHVWHDVFSVVVGYDAWEGFVRCNVRCSVSYLYVTWRRQCFVGGDTYEWLVCCSVLQCVAVCCNVCCGVSCLYVTWCIQCCRRIWRMWRIGELCIALQCVLFKCDMTFSVLL